MARALPPLNWFRSFEAAARHLSFTTAAGELGLTQSAVSQQVRALETRLGVQLFIRKSRGLSITDDGRKLLPQVGTALETLGIAAGMFDAGPAHNVLTVAASVSVMQWILNPNIGLFCQKHPDLRIRFQSTIWPDDFVTAVADVEVRFGTAKQVGQGAVRLGPDRLMAVSGMQPPRPIEEQVLIETVGTSGNWKDWQRKAANTKSLSPQIHVDSFGQALDLAMKGQGVALVSSLLAAEMLKSGQLTQIHPVTIDNPEGYFLAINEKSAFGAEFGHWLQGILAHSNDDGPNMSAR